LVEHEYRRRGARAYLSAMDVHNPHRGLFGHVRPRISNDAGAISARDQAIEARPGLVLTKDW
jgi:hypothetical protein